MITRPLKLAEHLRIAPRNFDLWFLVNAGLLALFFVVFGSRFVISPGLAVDFQIPTTAGNISRLPSGSREVGITVDRAGLMYVNEGMLKSTADLRLWLKKQNERKPGEKLPPSLGVFATANVPFSDLLQLLGEARKAGFADIRLDLAKGEPAVGGKP